MCTTTNNQGQKFHHLLDLEVGTAPHHNNKLTALRRILKIFMEFIGANFIWRLKRV
jgi:hypothetical protein